MPKLITNNITPTSQSDAFVGREHELRDFRANIRYLLGHEIPPNKDHNYPHIFLIHGECGMGKSALLCQILSIAAQEGMSKEQIIHCKFDNRHYFSSARELANSLAASIRQKHPDFDKKYQQAHARRTSLIPRYRELKRQWARWEALRDKNTSDSDTVKKAYEQSLRYAEREKAIHGVAYTPPHILAIIDDATENLSTLSDIDKESGNIFETFSDLLRHEFGDEAILFQSDDNMGLALAEDIFNLAETAPLLLAIDAYEHVDQFDDWFRNTILHESSDRMITVISGRNQHTNCYKQTFYHEYDNLVRVYDLNNKKLSLIEIQNYIHIRLRSSNKPSKELVSEIQEISRGVPVVIKALGDRLAAGEDIIPYSGMKFTPSDRRAVVHDVTKQFLHYVLDDIRDNSAIRERKLRDRQRIRALSLLLHPDAELACAMWGVSIDEGQKIAFDLARRYSFIFADDDSCDMHSVVRDFVREDTKFEKNQSFDWPALVAGLHRIVPIIRARINLTNLETYTIDEYLNYNTWRELHLDLLNALLWLEDDTAQLLLINRWVEAQFANSSFAVDLISIALDLSSEAPKWKRLLSYIQNKDISSLKFFDDLLYTHTRAILCHLHAESLVINKSKNEDILHFLTRKISILEEGWELNVTWQPICIALSAAYSTRGIYNAKKYNHYIDAIADFDRALVLQPEDASTLYNRGISRSCQGDLEGALLDFEKAIAIHPDNHVYIWNRGAVKQKLGDLFEALYDYDQALKICPDDPNALNNRGVIKEDQGKLVDALADYDRSLALQPNTSAVLNNRGSVRYKLGDILGAIIDWSRSTKLTELKFPDRPLNDHYPDLIRISDKLDAFCQRGRARVDIDDLTGALDEFNQGLKICKNDIILLADRAFTHHKLNNLEGALRDYNAVLTLQFDNSDMLIMRSVVKRQIGDLAGALQDCDYALTIKPKDFVILYNRGLTKCHLNSFADALIDFDQVLDLYPNHPFAYWNRGTAKYMLGNPIEALVDYECAISLRPDDPDALSNRGGIKVDQGDLLGALADYNRAITLCPESPILYSNRGNARLKMGDITGALEDFQYALEVRPDDSATLTQRGIVKQHLDDLAGALSDFEQALLLQPDNLAALHNCGMLKANLGYLLEALEYLKRTLELCPDDPNLLRDCGIIQHKLNDLDNAIQNYNHALVLHPNDLVTLNNRAIARRLLGDLDGAIKDFELAIQLDANNTELAYEIACLHALQADADIALQWLIPLVQAEARFRDIARQASDFEAIRTDPRFLELVKETREK